MLTLLQKLKSSILKHELGLRKKPATAHHGTLTMDVPFAKRRDQTKRKIEIITISTPKGGGREEANLYTVVKLHFGLI